MSAGLVGVGAFLMVLGIGFVIPAAFDPRHANSPAFYVVGVVLTAVGAGLLFGGVVA